MSGISNKKSVPTEIASNKLEVKVLNKSTSLLGSTVDELSNICQRLDAILNNFHTIFVSLAPDCVPSELESFVSPQAVSSSDWLENSGHLSHINQRLNAVQYRLDVIEASERALKIAVG